MEETLDTEKNAMTAASGSSSRGSMTLVSALCIVSAVALVAAFFLPYLSATPEYRESLDALGELASFEDGVSGYADVSLFDYVRVYGAVGEADAGAISTASSMIVAVYAIPVVLAVLILLFSLLRKPTAMLVFGVPMFAYTFWISSLYGQWGSAGTGVYDLGVAHWVYLVAGAAVIVFAIWLFVLKHQAKKARTR